MNSAKRAGLLLSAAVAAVFADGSIGRANGIGVNDIVVGTNSGTNGSSAYVIHNPLGPAPAAYAPWNTSNFQETLSFDNLGTVSHNHAGNLLAVNFGTAGTTSNTTGG